MSINDCKVTKLIETASQKLTQQLIEGRNVWICLTFINDHIVFIKVTKCKTLTTYSVFFPIYLDT